jgi:hypothetical protein
VEPFFKNNIQHANFWERLNFPQDWGLIPQFEPKNLMLITHLKEDKKL